MKKASSILFVVASLFVLNLQRPPVADKATIGKAQVVNVAKGKKFKVNTSLSTLKWIGTKPTGNHTGTISIKEGTVSADKTTLTGGSFVLDMTTINNTDLQGKGKESLEGHLKSADFFDVTKFPAANFEVTNVAAIDASQKPLLEGATHTITGNLTMKGITKSISFPAIVSLTKKEISAKADFNIDRTEWDINYGADGKVAKEINLKLNLQANK